MLEESTIVIVMESGGHCFLCLNRLSEDSSTSTTTSHSFQYLSSYLGLDLTGLFSKEVRLTPEVKGRLERSKLRAKLCEGCASVSDRFSELCGQLERIRMEVGLCLRSLQGKLTKTEIGWQELAASSMDQILALQIAEALRNQLIEKCALKLCQSQPRVLIPKLKMHASVAPTCPIDKPPSTSPEEEVATGSGPTLDEPEAHPNWEHGVGEVTVNVSEPIKLLNFPSSKDKTFHEKPQRICPLCGMTFNNSNSLHRHHQSVHFRIEVIMPAKNKQTAKPIDPKLIVKKLPPPPIWAPSPTSPTRQSPKKWKCKECGGEFTTNGGLWLHRKSVHMGLRYKCKACNNIFTQKSNLRTHQAKFCRANPEPVISQGSQQSSFQFGHLETSSMLSQEDMTGADSAFFISTNGQFRGIMS